MPSYGVKKEPKKQEVEINLEIPRVKSTRRVRSAPRVGYTVNEPLPVTCHFYAQMKKHVKVGDNTLLSVFISRRMIDLLERTALEGGTANVDAAEKLVVKILIKNGFTSTDGAQQQEVSVPDGNSISTVEFGLKADDEETNGEIIVLVRQRHVNILKLVLKPSVVLFEADGEHSTPGELIEAQKTTDTQQKETCPIHQLQITEQRLDRGIVYNFQILSQDLQVRVSENSNPIQADREKYVNDKYTYIEDRYLRTKGDFNNFVQELRAIGVEMFEELVPPKIRKALWDLRNKLDSIQLIASEPFIPWELVHLKEPGTRGMPQETLFLGDMGLIRWLEGEGENGWPVEQILVRDDKVGFVIPNYPHPDYKLREAQEEKQFLIDVFQAREIVSESGIVRGKISTPGEFDLLHFACHGDADSSKIGEAALLMEGRIENNEYIIDNALNVTVVSSFCNLAGKDNYPLVVLNACRAGRTGYSLTRIGGFSRAFISGGAGAFVGALWSVGDFTARAFAEVLYTELLKGETLGSATRTARAHCAQQQDSTWLAYVVYGNPCMRLKRI